MICQCGKKLHVTHTYHAGPVARVRRLACSVCRKVYRSTEMLERTNTNGVNGAYARAQELKKVGAPTCSGETADAP